MRKLIISLMIILVAASSAYGTDKGDIRLMLDKIEKANAELETLQGRFLHERIGSDGIKEDLEGMLYVTSDNLAMHYDKADRELFMIRGDKIHMIRRGKTRDLNIKIIKPMKSLKETLIYSMLGKVASLSESQASYEVDFSEKEDEVIVVFRSKKKSMIGYEKIVNTYDSANFTLKKMEMVEFNGNISIYSVESAILNQRIDSQIFDVDAY